MLCFYCWKRRKGPKKLITGIYEFGFFLSNYPLARNQYVNNSPGKFSCIRPGVNTCTACICTEINSPKIVLCIGNRDVRIQAPYQYRGQGQSANTYFKNNSSKIVSCIRTSANTGPTCIRAKLNSSRIFPACIGFVPGGMAVSWCITLFQKKLAENPICIAFLGARFLGQGVKKGKFWQHTKKGKKWLITEKLLFWYFCVFLLLLFFLVFFVVVLFFVFWRV